MYHLYGCLPYYYITLYIWRCKKSSYCNSASQDIILTENNVVIVSIVALQDMVLAINYPVVVSNGVSRCTALSIRSVPTTSVHRKAHWLDAIVW